MAPQLNLADLAVFKYRNTKGGNYFLFENLVEHDDKDEEKSSLKEIGVR